VVTVVAAWMLDPVTCAAMAIGAPRVAVSALIDLHHLLIERTPPARAALFAGLGG
jgi:hypothetical protein